MTTIKIQHPDITELPVTTLSADEAAAQTTLSVVNGLAFSARDFVVINGYGNATSELRKISASAPTANAIVLDASYALQFAQTAGTTIQETYYDQIDIEYSTNCSTLFATGAYATPADAADAATWTNLTTTNITPQEKETIYQDTSTATRSYRTRYYNSHAGIYSSYSDPILPTGFEEFAAGSIIEKALNATGKEISKEPGGQYSMDFFIEQINIAGSDVDSRRKRWSWNQDFNYALSEITSGKWDYLLPTTIDIDYTKRSFFNARVANSENLTYLDKRQMDQITEDTHNTTLAEELNTSSTTITLTDSSDFDDSGTFTVITGSTKDTVTYTANNRTTNVLTLDSTTGVSTTHASGQNVWQSASIGTPEYYSIWEGYLYLWPIPGTDLYQKNITIDFYKKYVKIDSYQDYVLFPYPNIIYYWLCHAIYEKAGDDANADKYEARYEKAIDTLIKKETTGQRTYLSPILHDTRETRRLMPTKKYDSE